jgi:hypothetical protein
MTAIWKPWAWALLLGAALAQLAACGGGEGEASPTAVTSAAPAKSATAVNVPQLPLDIGLLLDWAERTYPTLFPGHKPNLELSPYTYRHYPETGNYVGVAGDDVYILGPQLSNNLITRVASREDFRCQVTPSDCVMPGYARGGWVASLSRLQHGVSGTVTIVDERTLRITGFNYDGGGPQVYAYLGSDNSNAAFLAGKTIGRRLNGGGAFVNATLELQLPEGQTLDGYTALSIWCADFRVNFGSGSFQPPPPPAAARLVQ